MEYENKYNEALKRAAIMYKSEDKSLKKSLEQIFPELRGDEDEKIRKALIEYIKKMSGDYIYGIPVEDTINWLERQSKQTQEAINEEKVDKDIKIESKFKTGDWIVKTDKTSFSNDSNFARIIKVDKKKYWFDTGTYLKAEHIRHWTIEDAKEGDVLANEYHILILKDLIYGDDKAPRFVKAYCGIDADGDFVISDDNWYFCDAFHIHPATEDQRKLLFKKMESDGYKWDSENRRLTKLKKD